MYEVEAGKIAGQKGESDAVKQFGQHMVEAHSQTTEQLKGIVQAETIKVDLPTKLDDKHQRMIDDLNAALAGDFDKTYAKQQVNGHEKAEELFSKYADKGDNEAVKAFAAKTLPVIKQILKRLRSWPHRSGDCDLVDVCRRALSPSALCFCIRQSPRVVSRACSLGLRF